MKLGSTIGTLGRALCCTAILLGLVTTGVLGPTTAAEAGVGCPRQLSRSIPERPRDAPTGSQFLGATALLGEREREPQIAAQLLAGNIPSFLRQLQPVTLQGQRPDHRPTWITICVAPDYLALGSDADFVRMPMALPTALAVADRFGFVLPTAKMVDAIYAQATVRLTPQPLPASDWMRSNAYIFEHNRRIRGQRLDRGGRLGGLTAGQKKDLVVTNQLWRRTDRVAIYGWHRADHDPIQPLSTAHGIRYADYSHGVRLVGALAYVDGRPRRLTDVLADPDLADVLSDEGRIPRLALHSGDPRELAAVAYEMRFPPAGASAD